MATETLKIIFRRESHIPLYLQIKRGIRDALLDAPQDKELLLPPQRELAQRLGVSRNTVSMAYAELEREGLVASRVGKGTTVVNSATHETSLSKQAMLSKAFEQALEQALSLGFTMEEYIAAAQSYIEDREREISRVRVVCSDDNKERLDCLVAHLTSMKNVNASAQLLNGEPSGDTIARLRGAEVVVTCFHQLEAVKSAVANSNTTVVGAYLHPDLSTVASIAHVNKKASIGLLASSDELYNEMASTLKKIGVSAKRVHRIEAADAASLEEAAADTEVLIAPPLDDQMAEAVADLDLIEFRYAVDDQSARAIRSAVHQVRQQGQE